MNSFRPESSGVGFKLYFIPPLEEDHVPKLLKKKIQRERVENAMKNGGQRIAIDFTLSEDMSNKVNKVFLRQSDDFHCPH